MAPAPFRDTMSMESTQQKKHMYSQQLAAYTRQQYIAARKAYTSSPQYRRSHANGNGASGRRSRSPDQQRSPQSKATDDENSRSEYLNGPLP